MASETHHLVGGVVGLELLVGGVLDVDRVVPDERGDGGVVAHHRLGALLAVELQERLHAGQHGERRTAFLRLTSGIYLQFRRPPFLYCHDYTLIKYLVL